MKIFLIVLFIVLVIMESGEMSYLLPSWFAGGDFTVSWTDDIGVGAPYMLIVFKDGSTLIIRYKGLITTIMYTGLEYETAGRIGRFVIKWPVNRFIRKLVEKL